MAAGIDHGGIPVDGPFRDAGVIILVDMPVDEVFRAVLVQQGHKALKTPVGPGVKVVDVPRRRVGEQDVKPAVLEQLKPQPADAAAHLGLGIHVLPVPVAVAAPQAQNAHPLVDIDHIVDADAALRGGLVEALVVVAVDIEQRAVCHGDQKLQVLPAQIPTGEDQIKPAQPARHIVVVVVLRFHIGDGQHSHGESRLTFDTASTPTMSTVALPVSLSSS